MVNAALYLRRPLLVTGSPGAGKSTLAHAVAYELRPRPGAALADHQPHHARRTGSTATTPSPGCRTSQIAAGTRRHRPRAGGIGSYIRLGPLGTALLPAARPRVLLIDELDKSDIDLPNDLLNVLRGGRVRRSPSWPGSPSAEPPGRRADRRRTPGCRRAGPGALPGLPVRGPHQQRRARLPRAVAAPLHPPGAGPPRRRAAAPPSSAPTSATRRRGSATTWCTRFLDRSPQRTAGHRPAAERDLPHPPRRPAHPFPTRRHAHPAARPAQVRWPWTPSRTADPSNRPSRRRTRRRRAVRAATRWPSSSAG